MKDDTNFEIQSRGAQTVGKENNIPDMSTETNDYRDWVFIFIVIASTVIYVATIVYKIIKKRLTKRNTRKNLYERKRET